MNYEEAIAYLFGRINYERRSPPAADLKLDRMRLLMRQLDDPHHSYPIIHIAGSKGKGSTAAMLANVLAHNGLRTGLFTSPHLVDVKERIQVDGRQIARDELALQTAKVSSAIANQHAFPDAAFTFFEIVTALGFLHFAHAKVDVAVIEVGLGGRFDSTNVCDPALSVITSISFDHVAQLGRTLAKIASEKAGIVKPRRPVVSGATQRAAREVIEDACRRKHSELIQLGRDLDFHYEPARFTTGKRQLSRVSVTSTNASLDSFELGLIGQHQAANASLVVACVDQLRAQGFAISENAVRKGLAGVNWPARFEVIGQDPWVILDCAHNNASTKALLKTLRSSFECFQRTDAKRYLIFAGSREKDLRAMLHILAPHFSHVLLTGFANNPRCVPPALLADYLPDSVSRSMHIYSESALRAAQELACDGDLICVTGSVFLAGELRPILSKMHQTRPIAVP